MLWSTRVRTELLLGRNPGHVHFSRPFSPARCRERPVGSSPHSPHAAASLLKLEGTSQGSLALWCTGAAGKGAGWPTAEAWRALPAGQGDLLEHKDLLGGGEALRRPGFVRGSSPGKAGAGSSCPAAWHTGLRSPLPAEPRPVQRQLCAPWALPGLGRGPCRAPCEARAVRRLGKPAACGAARPAALLLRQAPGGGGKRRQMALVICSRFSEFLQRKGEHLRFCAWRLASAGSFRFSCRHVRLSGR